MEHAVMANLRKMKNPFHIVGRGRVFGASASLIFRNRISIPLDLAPFPKGMVAATSSGQSLGRS